jgi:Putative adhesin
MAAAIRLTRGRRVLLVVGGLVVVALVGYGVLQIASWVGLTTVTEETSLTPRGDQLRVDADGDVQLVPRSGTDVRVRTTAKYGVWRPKLEAVTDDAGVRLRSHCSPLTSSCSVSYRVEVPAGITKVQVNSSAGNVDVTAAGISDALLQSSAGDVRAELAGGTVTAKSSAGEVRLTFTAPPDSVTAESSAGDVLVELPATPGGYRVTADSSAGTTEVSVPRNDESSRRIDVHSSAGDARVRLRSG